MSLLNATIEGSSTAWPTAIAYMVLPSTRGRYYENCPTPIENLKYVAVALLTFSRRATLLASTRQP